MLKKYAPILLFLFGLLFSIFLGYSVWNSGYLQTAEDKQAEEQLAADKKAAEEKAVAEKAAAEKAEAEKAEAEQETVINEPAIDIEAIQSAMSFDILRIEPSGDTVIAGLAPAGSKVEIVNALTQNSVIAKATARDSGEFALVLDTPLSEGKHELYIQAWDKKENKFVSNEIALVEVFTASMNKIPVVILSKTGAATRILQGEEMQVAQEETAEEAEQSQEQVSEETTTSEEESASVEATASEEVTITEEATITEEKEKEEEVRSEVASLSEETAEVVTEQAAVIPDPLNAVFIKAADIENGNLIIAGVGPIDGVLNIYINDQLLGQTKIAANNAFILEKSFALEAGRHSIRADRVDAATNKVLGRAEVTLIHEPEVAAVEETVTEEAATQEATVTNEEATTEEAPTTEEAATSEEAATTEVASATEEAVTPESTTEETATEETVTEEPVTVEPTSTQVASNTTQAATEEASTTEEITPTEEAVTSEDASTTEQATTTEAPASEEATPTEVASTSEETTSEEATSQENVTEEATEEQASTTEQASSESGNEEEVKTEIRTGTTVIIRRGDSLWRVSRKNYGEGVKFTTIFEANKDQIKNPNLIYPGQVLAIPE